MARGQYEKGGLFEQAVLTQDRGIRQRRTIMRAGAEKALLRRRHGVFSPIRADLIPIGRLEG